MIKNMIKYLQFIPINSAGLNSHLLARNIVGYNNNLIPNFIN